MRPTLPSGSSALIDVFQEGFLSDRNPFGALMATQSIDVLKIRSGMIAAWAGPTANIPSGWLLCDGRLVSKLAYADLWQVFLRFQSNVGYESRFGRNTQSQFRLPDLRRRVVIGWGGQKPAKSSGPRNDR